MQNSAQNFNCAPQQRRFFSNSCHFNAKLALSDENQGDLPIFAAKLSPFFVKQT
jgi:hypothetical protein